MTDTRNPRPTGWLVLAIVLVCALQAIGAARSDGDIFWRIVMPIVFIGLATWATVDLKRRQRRYDTATSDEDQEPVA